MLFLMILIKMHVIFPHKRNENPQKYPEPITKFVIQIPLHEIVYN